MRDSITPRLSLAANVCLVGLLSFLGVLFVVSSAYGDPEDKYHKHIEKYRERIRKAEKERREGDIDDYYEELGKAEKELRKAEEYRRDHRRYDKKGRHRKHDAYGWGRYPRRRYDRGFDLGWLGDIFGRRRRYDYHYPRRYERDDYCSWKCERHHRHHYPPYWCARGCRRHHRHYYRDYCSWDCRCDHDHYFPPYWCDRSCRRHHDHYYRDYCSPGCRCDHSHYFRGGRDGWRFSFEW